MNENVWPLILLGGGLLAFLLVVSFLSKNYSLNNFKSKTVGDGQHGTARWATPKEIHTTYHVVPFRPRRWRKGEELPTVQGIILGSMGGRKRRAKRGVISQTTHKLLERLRRPTAGKKEKRKPKKKKSAISKIKNVVENQRDVRALVDSDDIHCLMIGASGVGKTAYFLYANLEYASASGMSYLALDTKGDLARNYGAIASRYYGYKVSVIDLRNPTRSDGFNFLTLMNHYMDIARMHPENLAARARAEKYAKILAKTIINPDGDAAQYGENAFFYDSAEGLLTAIVLLLAEFAPCLLYTSCRRQALQFCLDPAVVVVIQICNEFQFEVFHGLKFLQVQQFALEQPEEVFYHRIVQTVSLAAHTLANTFLPEHLLVLFVLVLPALIGMENEVCSIRNFCKCLVQHGRHHAEHRTIRYGVTDQIAAAQIKDGREIELLSKQTELCHIGDPLLVRPVRMEVPIQ